MVSTGLSPLYAFPFLLFLATWEGLARREPPVLALAATVLAWVTFQELPDVASADMQSLVFLGWSVPLAGCLGVRAFAPGEIGKASTRRRRVHVSRGAAPIRGA